MDRGEVDRFDSLKASPEIYMRALFESKKSAPVFVYAVNGKRRDRIVSLMAVSSEKKGQLLKR